MSVKKIFRCSVIALFALLAVISCAMLSGCSEEKYPTRAYTFTDELGGNYRIEFSYDGDVVLKQYQQYTLYFGGIEGGIKDVIRSNAKSVSDGYEKYDYIIYEYRIRNEKFTERVTINDINLHAAELSENKFIPVQLEEGADYISLKLVEETLLASGWTVAE